MITLKKKQETILLHAREGYSQRKIASLIGVNRKTVGKYIREYETRKKKLLNEDKNADTGELIQEIIEAQGTKNVITRKEKKSIKKPANYISEVRKVAGFLMPKWLVFKLTNTNKKTYFFILYETYPVTQYTSA